VIEAQVPNPGEELRPPATEVTVVMASEPVAELHPGYSSAGARATPWSEVVAVLERAEIYWIATVRADGRPHVTPIPAMWLDGALHFSTGLED
jgi:hypothetical protein